MELEFQSEIDKLLFSSILLEKQSGKPHTKELYEIIFHRSSIYHQNRDLYEEAHELANRFWWNYFASSSFPNNSFLNKKVQEFFRLFYKAPLHEKTTISL
tara:strand:- start:325 stop:624 length:300 start_codon:yes stop_codon:yes gene_type:complete